jgi:hypothetical protein
MTKYCDNCGRPFELDRPLEAPHKRFCSPTCRSDFHNKARRARREARAADNITVRTVERTKEGYFINWDFFPPEEK